MVQRITRPLHWTSTSRFIPRTSPGIRRENCTDVPAAIERSIAKRTPLAETFSVVAAKSSPFDVMRTASFNGNRPAHLTSWCSPAFEIEGEEFIAWNRRLAIFSDLIFLSIDELSRSKWSLCMRLLNITICQRKWERHQSSPLVRAHSMPFCPMHVPRNGQGIRSAQASNPEVGRLKNETVLH